jgi:hypothetical protein
MIDKKICVFAYDFKHLKTQNGLINMFMSGYKPSLVVLQGWKKLKIKKSNIRVTPKDFCLLEPRLILDKLNINYIIADHNSKLSITKIKEENCDIGVILGSRILSKNVIDCFKTGILNLHPGILPLNRGLDTIQWAVVKNIKQGATSHIINKEIDKGFLVMKENIEIFKDDTLIDIYMRISSLEQDLLIKSLNLLINQNFKPHIPLESGEYHSTLLSSYKENFNKLFKIYKENTA